MIGAGLIARFTKEDVPVSTADNNTSANPRYAPTAERTVKPKTSRRLRSILSLDDFEAAAQRHLPRPVFGYIAGATEAGITARANRNDFADIRLSPEVLAGHAERDQRTTLMGVQYAYPFGIAPMGLSALAAYDGDVVLARAADSMNIPAVMSGTSLTRLERVAEEAKSRWFQAYLPGDDARIEAMVQRVADAGFETFVITVDVPVTGNRENNVRNGFEVPLRPSLTLALQGLTHPRWLLGTALRTLRVHGMPHFESMDVDRGPPILSRHVERSLSGRQTLSWHHVALVRRLWKGKLVLKGVLSAADARRAAEHFCDGVIVSNHGGRQLDSAVSSIHALPEIVKNRGDMAIMLDSGVRRGTDVVKALALGADFVFVGRPFLYAAAIAGDDGVRHCANILGLEVDRNLALLGARTIGDLQQKHVVTLPSKRISV